MPKFTKAACDRIVRDLTRFEGQFADNTGQTAGHSGVMQPWLVWYQLTEAIDADTHEADANPGKWDASGDDGAGELTADTSTTRKVRDTTGSSGAGKSSWVLCRPVGSDDGTVWEIVTNWANVIGKLDGSLSHGGSATVSVWGGTPGSEADTGINITARDWLMKTGATAIASGKKVVCTLINGTWYVTEAECP